MLNFAIYVIFGVLVGAISGLIGIGGGLFIIPALLYIFHLSQHQAQGTTLALMVPPIGLLAAWTYYKKGFVIADIAAGICLGFFFGGLLGARIACSIDGNLLRKIFGLAMVAGGIYTIFK
ncbi:MAG: TSUP family transporter [Elusimicrobia bacterium]|nr:TSUP family transporter [Elusimicrobiota bacterium]